MTSAINFRGDTDAFTFGVFAVDELTLLPWLKIMGGLRYDLFDADFRNAFLGQKFSRTDTDVSPRTALIIQPTKQQTYYFSYGQSFNPSAESLSLAVNNADTAPETIRVVRGGGQAGSPRGRRPRRHHRAVPDRQEQRADHRPGAGRHGPRG